ncbi:MAG: aminoglycoside phosphotransferase family protein [Micromonosporaceae bacterium]|nr:aminoglycoside phosphotransferase family protein [Micromonosporaceae bacterium]
MNARAAALLLDLCRSLVDPHAEPITLHAGHNGTAALRATATVGEVIVKLHRNPDRHQQEVDAYHHWTAALGDHAPQLVAINDNPAAIIITALPGQPLAEASASLSPAREADIYRQAGKLLQRLHGAAPPRWEPDMTAWLAERGEHWLALAQDLLPAPRRTEIRAHLRALTQLPPIPAVPCHLDYTPRNLLIQPTGDVAVIDFEHTRYDLAARDFVRLATRVWTGNPALERAFSDGYGSLTSLDRQVIEHCTHLDRLTSAVRAAGRSLSRSTPRLVTETAKRPTRH